ncbi:hypothetical protein CDL15_Pgr014954 [Punica granatum]|uniref:Uncharacterized protein n=1 Tax=Punica granatum TaxID=22663 RepID=A0A218WYZ5_PUNGR|nr:hypothetical protein CDL15_Pgr014954 [Punica granatum]
MALNMLTVGSTVKYRKNLFTFPCSLSSHHLNSFAFKIFSDGSLADGLRLSSVNGLWLDKPQFVNPSFKKVLETT